MVKYDTSKFHGVFVALNASYDANGELNTEKLKELALWYHSLGVKGLYVCGSTGEGMLLTAEERKASVKAVCEAVGGKLVILCHVGAPSTRQAVELAKHAESCGVDAVSAVPCVFYIHSEDAIANHWNTITEAVDLPFFIYNIPQLTGYNLSRGLFERMLQNEKIAGIKNSNEVAHQIMQFKALGGENFIVLNGPDEQYLAGRLNRRHLRPDARTLHEAGGIHLRRRNRKSTPATGKDFVLYLPPVLFPVHVRRQ